MNREYTCKVSSKNSKRLLKNFQNTTGLLFFAAPCINCIVCLISALTDIISMAGVQLSVEETEQILVLFLVDFISNPDLLEFLH